MDRAKRIADTYRSAGMSIHALGVYLTLIHGDAAERKANLAYFDSVMKRPLLSMKLIHASN